MALSGSAVQCGDGLGARRWQGQGQGVCPASWPATDGPQRQGFPRLLLLIRARPRAEGQPVPCHPTGHTAWKGHPILSHTVRVTVASRDGAVGAVTGQACVPAEGDQGQGPEEEQPWT